MAKLGECIIWSKVLQNVSFVSYRLSVALTTGFLLF